MHSIHQNLEREWIFESYMIIILKVTETPLLPS